MKGKHEVKYGEAGDCYSSLSCPQGRFSINLQGTAFKVSESTTWAEYGKDPSIRVNRFEVSPAPPHNPQCYRTSIDLVLVSSLFPRAAARWRANAVVTAGDADLSRASSWTSYHLRRTREGSVDKFPWPIVGM